MREREKGTPDSAVSEGREREKEGERVYDSSHPRLDTDADTDMDTGDGGTASEERREERERERTMRKRGHIAGHLEGDGVSK